MADKLVQRFDKKTYSNVDLLKLANTIIGRLGEDAENGNEYAIMIIKEVFNNKVGRSATRPSKANDRTQVLPPNRYVQELSK